MTTTNDISPRDQELAEISAAFETTSPGAVLKWAFERFGDDVVLACSFQDIVLLDLGLKVNPKMEVIFLDTEFHFPETLDYVEAVRARYNLNLTVTHPGPEASDTTCGAEGCCGLRKVAPLRRAVSGKGAWLTSLKRVDAPTRQAAPIISWDESFSLVKINPLATWTDKDINSYERDHDLLIHPLISRGYLSIGCAPTTRPVASGEDPRSGRWSGSDKLECGLHEAS